MSHVESSFSSRGAAASEDAGQLKLVTLHGPTPIERELSPPGPVRIGRRSGSDIQLSDEKRVSRDHAVLLHDPGTEGGRWFLTDAGSRHGTRLNGVRVSPEQRYPLRPGDVIEIHPWVLRVVDPALGTEVGAASHVQTLDDDSEGSTIYEMEAVEGGMGRQATVLLSLADRLHEAEDERALAETVVEAGAEGTGFTNAALLRPMDEDGRIPVLAYRGEIVSADGSPRFSRSLIRRASSGRAVRLQHPGGAQPLMTHSVAELGISSAICIPLSVHHAVIGYLYLDRRGESEVTIGAAQQPEAFARGLGHLAAVAWGNLMRRDLERRYQRVESDLQAASQAQAMLMPRGEHRIGPLRCVGRNQPGRMVSGDFFDVLALDDRRVGVILGDATGKGAEASVLMTLCQGFLNAQLRKERDLDEAMSDLNAYIHAHTRDRHFLTVWAGVFDAERERLRYVDAGHSYAARIVAAGGAERLDAGEGLPLGVEPSERYEAAEQPFGPGDAVLVVSDGLVEQPAAEAEGDEHSQMFGWQRLVELVAGRCSPAETGDPIAAVFEAVAAFAESERLHDDATAVLVRHEHEA